GVCIGIIELAGGGIEREEDVFTEFVAGFLDRHPDGVKRVFNPIEIWGETSFIANRSGKASRFQNALECMKDLCTIAKRFRKGRGSFRNDHELLEIDRGIRMDATVNDVHHGDRQHFGVRAPQITEQRKIELGGGGVRNRQRTSKNRVCAKFLFAGGTVERKHRAIYSNLIERVHAGNGFGDLVFDVVYSFQYAFAEILVFVSVAQFPSFVFSCARSAWNDSTADCAAG